MLAVVAVIGLRNCEYDLQLCYSESCFLILTGIVAES